MTVYSEAEGGNKVMPWYNATQKLNRDNYLQFYAFPFRDSF